MTPACDWRNPISGSGSDLTAFACMAFHCLAFAEILSTRLTTCQDQPTRMGIERGRACVYRPLNDCFSDSIPMRVGCWREDSHLRHPRPNPSRSPPELHQHGWGLFRASGNPQRTTPMRVGCWCLCVCIKALIADILYLSLSPRSLSFAPHSWFHQHGWGLAASTPRRVLCPDADPHAC